MPAHTEIAVLESKLRELLAREPLSEVVIREMYGEESHWDMVAPYVIAFARTIERAHGIGNESKEM